jgi:hypothetical protein
MPALVAGIHALLCFWWNDESVNGRNKSGHDG